MGHLQAIGEFIVITSFSLFLFIAPYSRLWGKYTLICSLFLVIITRFVTGRREYRTAFAVGEWLRPPIVFCVLSCGASILFSQDPYQSQKIFFSRYLFFFASVWAGFVIGRDFRRSAINYFVYSMIAISLYMTTGGMWDYSRMSILEPRLWTIWGRYTAFNMLPLYLVFYVCFNYSFLIAWGGGYHKWPALINTCLFMPVIFWQQCRSAYPAIATGLCFVNFFKNRKFFLGGCIACFAFVTVLALLSTPFRVQMVEYLDMNKWDNRLPLFHSALEMFRDHPVAGVGIGMFEGLIRTSKYEPPADYMPQYRDFFIHTHNFYLETLSETGLIGMAAFAAVFVSFFRRLFRGIRAASDCMLRSLLVGLGGIIVVYLVFGITLSIITVGLTESSIFWLLFGVTLGVTKRKVSDG